MADHRQKNSLFRSLFPLHFIFLCMKSQDSDLRIALVTDWLTNIGGAEKVVRAIADLYPEAPIYTTFLHFDRVQQLFPERERLRSSVFSKIPSVANRQMTIAPFLRSAISSLDLSDYDIILSFSSSVAKNIRVKKGQKHICYIHTPARYIWQREDDDRFEKLPKLLQPLVGKYLDRLKLWDSRGTEGVDLFVANSSETARRVKKFYGRETQILYPPVSFEDFSPCKPGDKKDYFFGFGRFVKYKKFDLLVDAFLQMPDKKLVLGGQGPEWEEQAEKVKKSGTKNIEFLGRLPFGELKKYLSEAEAMLLPQKEDAGIVQLEAFASGTPVIAYKAAGVLDVLEEGINGVFFDEQTSESLIKTVQNFEVEKFAAKKVRATAEKYSTENFIKNYKKIVDDFLR
jgi:glycosyltransferase involved in cell wall biosynthesis